MLRAFGGPYGNQLNWHVIDLSRLINYPFIDGFGAMTGELMAIVYITDSGEGETSKSKEFPMLNNSTAMQLNFHAKVILLVVFGGKISCNFYKTSLRLWEMIDRNQKADMLCIIIWSRVVISIICALLSWEILETNGLTNYSPVSASSSILIDFFLPRKYSIRMGKHLQLGGYWITLQPTGRKVLRDELRRRERGRCCFCLPLLSTLQEIRANHKNRHFCGNYICNFLFHIKNTKKKMK